MDLALITFPCFCSFFRFTSLAPGALSFQFRCQSVIGLDCHSLFTGTDILSELASHCVHYGIVIEEWLQFRYINPVHEAFQCERNMNGRGKSFKCCKLKNDSLIRRIRFLSLRVPREYLKDIDIRQRLEKEENPYCEQTFCPMQYDCSGDLIQTHKHAKLLI